VNIYNPLGQLIKTDRQVPATGAYNLDIKSGIYIVSVLSGNIKTSTKILVFE
jgi:hypothetical protein